MTQPYDEKKLNDEKVICTVGDVRYTPHEIHLLRKETIELRDKLLVDSDYIGDSMTLSHVIGVMAALIEEVNKP